MSGGYVVTPQTGGAIPEILGGGLGVSGDSLTEVALESLRDGCLIEDFNADIDTLAAMRATDPAARELVRIIARDEREHGELAWSILAWCLEAAGERVVRAVAAELPRLPERGPHAWAPEERAMVEAADPEDLQDHGRVPAEVWPVVYAERLAATRTRALAMLEARTAQTSG